jgi:hypothetical protein
MMRMAIAISVLASSSSLHAQEATLFRGLHVNMSASEIRNFPSQQFVIDFPNADEARLFKPGSFKKDDKGLFANMNWCARIVFDDQAKAKSLIFRKCFFAAEDMNYRQLGQELVNHYPIDRLSCESKVAYGYDERLKLGPKLVSTCSGPTKNGEWITIDESGEVTVDRRGPDEKPTFD